MNGPPQKGGENNMEYAPEEILTLSQVAEKLRLDPRTVKRVAFALGGRRIGNRWRFKWGAVLEYFNNADFETEQRKSLDGAGGDRRQAGRLQDVPARKERRPGMAGCKRMGGNGTEEGVGGHNDPNGLRKAYGLG
ncbi:DNA-binding domain protein (modular protein) [uncultured delta proteobacterium]|uniref:DNA-binding domain protein (Modular protein) n=1 Tax=uncultured delta proteobacterium TaxID=34034 RepID=A0A212KGI0_9DELT|nr:DNA-binding domain protein (modular protein) [uncultured delta proteobacterium]